MKDSQGDPASCRTCIAAETVEAPANGPWRGKCHLRAHMTGVVAADQNGQPFCPVHFTHWPSVSDGDWCLSHQRDPERPYIAPAVQPKPAARSTLLLPSGAAPTNGRR